MVTVTVAMPAALAVILPEEGSTEAMVEALLAQTILLGFASLGMITGVSVDSCPTVRDNVLGMVTLSTGFSTGTGSETLMVQSLVILGSSVEVAVIVTSPTDWAVTLAPSRVTIPLGEADHVTWLFPLPEL